MKSVKQVEAKIAKIAKPAKAPKLEAPVTQCPMVVPIVVSRSAPSSPPVKPAKAKRILSEEQKQVLRERLVKAREVRASKTLLA